MKADFIFVRSPKIKSWITNAGKFNIILSDKGREGHMFFSGNGVTVWSLINGTRNVRDIKRSLSTRMPSEEVEAFLMFLWSKGLTDLKH